MARDRRSPTLSATTALAAALLAALQVSCAGGGPDGESTPLLDADLGATIETEWAGETGGGTQKLETSFRPELELRLGPDLRLTAIGRVRGDLRDRLEPGRPDQPEISGLSRRHALGGDGDFELREFHVSTDIGRTMLTLGKQQIVWGTADGLKVLDVVNPQDLREFILDDFDQSRIPLWAVNAERPLGPFVAQFVWIPDQTYHDVPAAGAAYALTSPRFVPATAAIPLAAERPHRFLADSDVGGRLSAFAGGWDMTLNYFFHYDDLSVPFLSSGPGGAFLVPRYRRTHLIGGTASNAFGSFTVRGEVGYSTSRNFLTADSSDADGVVESGDLGYVLGLDWSGLTDTMVSLQVFQSWLPEHRSGVVRDALDTTVTMLVRRKFVNDTLAGEVMWLQNLNDGDGLVRPKVTYELWDSTRAWLGADVFYGRRTGVFGQFDDRDRVVLGLELSF